MKKKLMAIVAAGAALALSAAMLAGCGAQEQKKEEQPEAPKYKVVASIQDEHYAIAFKKGNDNLAAVVNETIAELDAQGKVEELIGKYADQGMSYEDWCFKYDPETKADPIENLEFIVGFDAEYPPYGYVGDDGEYTGFDLDLAQLVCDARGWTLKKEAIDWDAKDALIESGQITCIWNGLTAEGREEAYTLSQNYMLNGQVVVVKGDSAIASADDLKDKTIVTQAGSAAQELLEGDMKDLKATFKAMETVPAYTTAFMQLESGACDAIICDKSIANVYLAGGEVAE